MKKVMIGLLIFISVSAMAQKDSLGMPIFEKKVGIQETITLDSTTKKELYVRSKIYFMEAFKSGKDVIQLDDPDNGIIIGKGRTEAYSTNFMGTAPLPITFSIKIEIKENRYRYTIYDVNAELTGTSMPVERYYEYPKMNKKLMISDGEH